MTSFITNEEEYADALRDNHHQTHKRHRLLLLTRGAFVNEECLFTEAEPLKCVVVVAIVAHSRSLSVGGGTTNIF